jgi:hypothetical protein
VTSACRMRGSCVTLQRGVEEGGTQQCNVTAHCVGDSNERRLEVPHSWVVVFHGGVSHGGSHSTGLSRRGETRLLSDNHVQLIHFHHFEFHSQTVVCCDGLLLCQSRDHPSWPPTCPARLCHMLAHPCHSLISVACCFVILLVVQLHNDMVHIDICALHPRRPLTVSLVAPFSYTEQTDRGDADADDIEIEVSPSGRWKRMRATVRLTSVSHVSHCLCSCCVSVSVC